MRVVARTRSYGSQVVMSRRDRVRLIRRGLDELFGQGTGPAWDPADVNLLLREFKLDWVSFEYDPRERIGEQLSSLDDDHLVEFFAAVLDVEDYEALTIARAADDTGLWTAGYVRLFLTHSAVHREFAGEV